VLHKPHERQVKEMLETLSEGPESQPDVLYRMSYTKLRAHAKIVEHPDHLLSKGTFRLSKPFSSEAPLVTTLYPLVNAAIKALSDRRGPRWFDPCLGGNWSAFQLTYAVSGLCLGPTGMNGVCGEDKRLSYTSTPWRAHHIRCW
jgi:hypothetical protein